MNEYKIGDHVVLVTDDIPDVPRYQVGVVVYVGITVYGIEFEGYSSFNFGDTKGWLVLPEEITHA